MTDTETLRLSRQIKNTQNEAVKAPESNSDGYFPQWDGENSKTLKDGYSTTDIKALTIAEEGSNSNGTYTKFTDGLLICYGTVDVQLSSSTGYTLKAFPYSFVDTNVNIVASPEKINGSASLDVYRIVHGERANSASNFYCYSSNYQSGSTYKVTLRYIAVGRWK